MHATTILLPLALALSTSAQITGSAITGNGNGGVIVDGSTLTGAAAASARSSIQAELSSEFAATTTDDGDYTYSATTYTDFSTPTSGAGNVVVDGTTLTGAAASSAASSIEAGLSSQFATQFGSGFPFNTAATMTTEPMTTTSTGDAAANTASSTSTGAAAEASLAKFGVLGAGVAAAAMLL